MRPNEAHGEEQEQQSAALEPAHELNELHEELEVHRVAEPKPPRPKLEADFLRGCWCG
jgi:hypothetical protein